MLKVGIPISIPKSPKVLPPTIIASITHIAESPTEFPTTLGYITLPSNC